MTGPHQRYLRLAVGVLCGLLVGIAIIVLIRNFGGGPQPGGVTIGSAGPGATAPATETRGEPVVMSLHDAPQPLPALRFRDGEGRPVALADFRGRMVLLNLWATWCGPCRREMPTLDRLQAELGGPDFEVVALSIDRAGIEAVAKFYAEVGVAHLAMYIDERGEAARQLQAVGLPTTLLIDREGREIARHVGPATWDTPEMMAFFKQRLNRNSGVAPPGRASKWAGSLHACSERAALRASTPDRCSPATGGITWSTISEGGPS